MLNACSSLVTITVLGSNELFIILNSPKCILGEIGIISLFRIVSFINESSIETKENFLFDLNNLQTLNYFYHFYDDEIFE